MTGPQCPGFSRTPCADPVDGVHHSRRTEARPGRTSPGDDGQTGAGAKWDDGPAGPRDRELL
jgi:hypothetical protein